MGSREPRSVLVVDDEEIKRYTVVRILTKAGFHVVEASTGAAALEAARANPDIVVLDVNLPDISGFEVCRRLKADPETSSIIVLHFSATLTDSGDKALGLEGGADGYLTEPVGAAELVATVRSMLRIREAERRANALAREWQTTFDAISNGVVLVDENDRVVRYNAAMAEFTDLPTDEILGTLCGDLAGDGAFPDGTPCAQARRTRGRMTVGYERDGRYYSVVADPVLDEKGEVTGSVCVVSDVTAAKERERERADLLERERDARAEAESANRAKDEFLATISHELRTPLNSMLGWITLLKQGRLSGDEAAHAVDVLERNAKSQAQLISDILDVSRIVTGKVRLETRDVDFALVVEAALDSVRPSAASKGVAIEVSLGEGDAVVSGDPERLQQVVWNLLSNAVKFTPKGGRVDVRLGREGSDVTLVVSDTGVGVDPAFLPFVFDRFRQADSSTTRVHSGLGLGLSIVRHLVELHGGTVTAESEGRGLGATFTISIPSRDAAGATDAATATASPEAAESRALARLDGVRVLVVDDDDDTRAMLTAVFEQCGAEVRPAASAREALDALVGFLPDAIVSDIGMPGTDGHALIRAVRALAPEAGGRVPALALTAYARDEDREQAIAAGFQAYLSKPAEPAALTAVVAGLVRN